MNNTNLKDRIYVLQSKPLSHHHSEVVTSFAKALRKWGRLSERQQAYLSSIEQDYDEAVLAERRRRLVRLENDEQYRKDVEIVCKYYIQSGYYRTTARNVLSYIQDPKACAAPPNLNSLEKMMDNKYARNILVSTNAPVKYQVGEIVQLRSNVSWDNVKACDTANYYPRAILSYPAFIVIEVDSRPISRPLTYNKTQGGTRWYKLLSLGDTKTFEVIERELKRPTKKMLGKK